jgi:malate synthase
VDAADKVVAYGNWLGLMRGDLEDTFEKDGERVTRAASTRTSSTTPLAAGGSLFGAARSFSWRNVGHLMTTPALLDRNGRRRRGCSTPW